MRVAEQRKQTEETAQDVFALGNPRDGFHAQWVQSEKAGDEKVATEGS